MPTLSRHHVHENASRLALLTGAAAALYLAAGVGMSYVAGFGAVQHSVEHVSWPWLPVSIACVIVAFAGYYFGYRGVGNVEGGAEDLDARARLAVVAAGFGGFLAYGGSSIDESVMRSAGASEREAKVRVTLLAGLEHGLLAVPCCIAAIALLAEGVKKPPHDFTLPWSIVPVPAFFLAVWLAERYRQRFRNRDGWRGKLAVLYDAIHLVRAMLTRREYWPGVGGMLLFWVADAFALWVALAAFGFRMNIAAAIVAFGTAMIVTRRTGPLGGAGLLGVALAATLWYSGAPWPAAVLGTFSYRFFTLWLPLPLSLLALPKLREILERGEEPAEEETQEPALQR